MKTKQYDEFALTLHIKALDKQIERLEFEVNVLYEHGGEDAHTGRDIEHLESLIGGIQIAKQVLLEEVPVVPLMVLDQLRTVVLNELQSESQYIYGLEQFPEPSVEDEVILSSHRGRRRGLDFAYGEVTSLFNQVGSLSSVSEEEE